MLHVVEVLKERTSWSTTAAKTHNKHIRFQKESFTHRIVSPKPNLESDFDDNAYQNVNKNKNLSLHDNKSNDIQIKTFLDNNVVDTNSSNKSSLR